MGLGGWRMFARFLLGIVVIDVVTYVTLKCFCDFVIFYNKLNIVILQVFLVG